MHKSFLCPHVSIGLIIFFISTLMSINLSSQRVQNPNFDKKINQLISYAVPVLSVDYAFRNKSNYLFLDARELEEYQVSHIPSARYVGYDDFALSSVSDVDKKTPIIIYCSIGYRSDKIGGRLKQAGFTKVFNLYGSIFEWVNHGYALSDDNGTPTLRLHTYSEDWGRWVESPNINKVW